MKKYTGHWPERARTKLKITQKDIINAYLSWLKLH